MGVRQAMAVLLVCCLLGCRSPGAAMQAWVGRTEADLLSSWGAPDSAVTLGDGSKVYTWKRIRGNQDVYKEGRQSFVISPDGTVKSFSYENMPRF